jgi:hypothetical protein
VTRRAATFALAAALLTPMGVGAATYTVSIDTPMVLGLVATAPSGDTVFRINPANGGVTVQSGAGRRVSTSSARSLVTVSCKPDNGGDNACTTDNVRVGIGALGTHTGRARTMTTPTVAMGTATLAVPPSGPNPLAFQLAPLGANAGKTFFVGADFPVAGDDSGLPSGAGTSTFYVYIVDQMGRQLAGDADTGQVTAFRALSITKTADLNFGRIQLPPSGSSTITLDAATGARTATGGAFLYPTPGPARAAFMVSGEGGQQLSLSLPASVTLTGPGSLEVTLTTSAPPAPSLSGGMGGGGTYGLNLGGSFTVTSTTPTGAYSGVVTVSLDYN